MDQTSVLIIQRIVPHYRQSFFQKLSTRSEMNVTVACGDGPPGSFLTSDMGSSTFACRSLRNRYLGPPPHIVFQRDLLSFVHSSSFDVIIAEFDLRILSNLPLLVWSKLRKRKFIWWGHGIGSRRHFLSKFIRVQLLHLADAAIFYDSDRAAYFARLGIPEQKLFVAWNSIDTEEIVTLADEWHSSNRYRILYIGRLIPEKKVQLLLDAFASALSDLPPTTLLTIIGDGPERARLEQIAVERGVEANVEFTGFLSNQFELAPYFNTALLSVSPGNIGLSAIHSMAYGIPVLVADDEPHGPEKSALSDGETAVFFTSDDSSALCSQLLVTLRDKESLASMSAAARRIVQSRFSTTAMVNSFALAVQSVVT